MNSLGTECKSQYNIYSFHYYSVNFFSPTDARLLLAPFSQACNYMTDCVIHFVLKSLSSVAHASSEEAADCIVVMVAMEETDSDRVFNLTADGRKVGIY